VPPARCRSVKDHYAACCGLEFEPMLPPKRCHSGTGSEFATLLPPENAAIEFCDYGVGGLGRGVFLVITGAAEGSHPTG